MDKATEYKYRKRISELEIENRKIRDVLYQYRTACSEIYDGIVSVSKTDTGVKISWILERLKRAWMTTP